MSLVKTLARVAAGVALAKGIGAVMNRSQGGQPTSSRQTGGGILGDLLQNNTSRDGNRNRGAGGLGEVLGGLLGGNSPGAGSGRRYGGPNSRAQGGLGGILDQIGGGAAAGGLGGMLGGMFGGGTQAAEPSVPRSGNLAQRDSQPTNDASFGELFNDSLITGAEPEVTPTPEQNAMAGLLLKAMIQAAKSDGKIDDAEKQRLMAEFGELDDEERTFIREQMTAPVDAAALAAETPPGMAQQVYMMSLMAIDFDSEAEARYLNSLATALKLDQQQVNQIHQHIGVQNLYA